MQNQAKTSKKRKSGAGAGGGGGKKPKSTPAFPYPPAGTFPQHALPLPKRPLVSYLLFSQRTRGHRQSLHPGLSQTELAKLTGEQWRSLSDVEKNDYKHPDPAKQADYERHRDQLAEAYYNTVGCVLRVPGAKWCCDDFYVVTEAAATCAHIQPVDVTTKSVATTPIDHYREVKVVYPVKPIGAKQRVVFGKDMANFVALPQGTKKSGVTFYPAAHPAVSSVTFTHD